MRIPFEWLKDYVDIDASLEAVCSSLTRIGLEIEGVEGTGSDAVLEVNVTPNRPDCLNLFGIARELAAVHGWPLKAPDTAFQFSEQESGVGVEIVDADLCHRYAARLVEGVRVGPSPPWMVRRLEQAGVRPINSVVDITNYVLMELGHPMHAFDRDRISGHKIFVARASAGEKLTTLDGVERKLAGHHLTIRDDSGPIALAGVMGGLNTEVRDSTSAVLLESAWFFPASIRRTSRENALSSESSYRFERGTDIEGLVLALDRATHLLVSLGGGRVVGPRIDAYPKRFSPSGIVVTEDRLRSLLGFDLHLETVRDILQRLSFKVEKRDEKTLSVVPPTFRRDVERDTDLAEEAARIHGYDKIPSRLPGGSPPAPQTGGTRGFVKDVKVLVRTAGFSEVVNFSFMNPEHLDTLGLASDDPRRNVISLLNPLRKEEGVLRTTLIPGLLENVSVNTRRGASGVRLFEVSKVFRKRRENAFPSEKLKLAAVLVPSTVKGIYSCNVSAFFQLKGLLDSLFRNLKTNRPSFEPSLRQPFLMPGQAAEIAVDGHPIGFIGNVTGEVLEALDIDREVTVCEIDLDELYPLLSKGIHFRPLCRYPFMERDISLTVPSDMEAASITKAIDELREPLIVSHRVFDLYSGKGIAPGKKSLAFSIRYLSEERTLTVEEVDRVHERLVSHLKNLLPVEVRGL